MASVHNHNTQKLLGSLIILLEASCFPLLWTAEWLNCPWINSLASYWLHMVSKVHLNHRNPIILGRDRKLSSNVLFSRPSVFLFVYLQRSLKYSVTLSPGILLRSFCEAAVVQRQGVRPLIE